MGNIKFDKFTNEANGFLNELSESLGHPAEQEKSLTVLRAVLHTIRDRITISESLDVLAQLPTMLKGIYVEQWKYRDTPMKFGSLEEMTKEVEERQSKYGEKGFDWEMSTADIISITMRALSKYLTQGQMDHIKEQIPAEIKPVITGVL